MEETKNETTMNILTQFQNLQQSGMLSSVENLKRENTDLIRIVNDISHLISLTEVDSMIDFLCSRFLEYFIPDRLVFLFQPPRKKQMKTLTPVVLLTSRNTSTRYPTMKNLVLFIIMMI